MTLLKLNIRVAKWTIQKYMRTVRPSQPPGQTWATFLHNHGADIWACDLLPVTDLLFRPLYAFFIVGLASRQVLHVGVTRHPTDAWLAQQVRAATPFGQHPKITSVGLVSLHAYARPNVNYGVSVRGLFSDPTPSAVAP